MMFVKLKNKKQRESDKCMPYRDIHGFTYAQHA